MGNATNKTARSNRLEQLFGASGEPDLGSPGHCRRCGWSPLIGGMTEMAHDLACSSDEFSMEEEE